MSTNERLLKLATADAATLARVDAVLNHADGATHAPDADCRLCTFTEAARLMKVSRPTIYRLVRAGRLDVVPLNGVCRILMRSIFDCVNGKGE